MAKLVNRAKMTTATTGTGTITLGSAVDGYQTFADAGVTDADVVSYVIEDGTSWEIGAGTYTASGTTLSRTVTESSNADAALNLSGDAVVFVTARAEDLATGGGAPALATSSGATQSVDFSASNKIHVATIDEDATISFVNPASVAKVDLILDVGGTAYNLDGAFYTDQKSGVFATNSIPFTGLDPSGMFAYKVNFGGNVLEQFEMSSFGDLTTLSTTASASVARTGPGAFNFTQAGDAFIMSSPSSNALVQYDLSTPWNISTAVLSSSSTSNQSASYSVLLASDGGQLFVGGSGSSGTVYDLPTANSIVGKTNPTTLAFPGGPTDIYGASMSPDGATVFVFCNGTDTIYQYDLSTPNDIRSRGASPSFQLNVSGQAASPYGGQGFIGDGSFLAIYNSTTKEFFKYATGSSYALILPESLQSPLIPLAPAKKTALTIVTYDGGTTYQAINVQGGIV